MASFKASVQYGDWEGTAAADDTDAGSLSLHRYLEQKRLIKPGEFLIAASLWVGENSEARLTAFLLRLTCSKGGILRPSRRPLMQSPGLFLSGRWRLS